MKQPFRILLVEDNQDDVELLQIRLNKLDLEFNLDVVDQKRTLIEYLEEYQPDLIISDYNLPGFTGMEALGIVRRYNKELPFILISGFIGEEKAVDSMLQGASDYVLKDNLERLGPAVKRELISYRKQKKTQKERDKAIRDLKERVKEQQCLYKISRLDDQKLSINELLQRSVSLIPAGWKYPEIAEASIEYDGDVYQTPNYSETDWYLAGSSDTIQSGNLKLKVVYLENRPDSGSGPFISEEQHLIESIVDLLSLKINRILDQEELERKQQLLEKTYDLAQIGNWEIDIVYSEIYWSSKTKEIHEVTDDFIPEMETGIEFYKEGKDRDTIRRLINRANEEGESFDVELRIITAKNNEKWIRVIGEPELENGKYIRIFGSVQDIDERKRAEEEVLKREQRFRSLVNEGSDIIAIIDVEGNYKYVAPTKDRMQKMGREPQEFYDQSIYDLLHPDYRARIEKSLHNIAPGESIQIAPFQYKGKEDAWRWMESTITNLTENPSINGYVTNSRDVTGRIEQERKLREIVENSTNLFYRHDPNHVITYLSPQSKDFLGCSPEKAKRMWTEFVTDHPVNEKGIQKTEKAIETGIAQDRYELQLKKTDGEIIWVEVNEAPVVENGETVAMVGSLTDITARKEYEEKLEELSLVASKTTDVIIMTDSDEKITWVNDAYEKLTKYSMEESLGKIPGDFLQGPDTDPETKKRISESIESRETSHEIILNYSKDGTRYWLDMKIDPIFEDGVCTGFIAIERDVTEMVQQRRKLQESVERYEIVTKATSDTIWDADFENDTVTYNSNIYDVFGYKTEEISNIGDWWLNKVHPKDRKRVDKIFKLAEKPNTDRVQVEYRFQCADGSYKYINDRAYIINDDDGNPIRMIGAMQDITKQKEENLWLKLLESAIANSNEAIAIIEEKTPRSPKRNIIYVNDAFETMTGFSKDDALGNSLLSFMGDKTNRKEIVGAIQALDSGQRCELEIVYKDKKDGKKWAHISFAPVKDDEGEFSHWICIGRDVTERRNRIRQLSDSLQEKETLLMEIHHRVKNNLAVVSSMMQLQAMEDQDEILQKKLYDSVSRIRTMVTIHEMLYESGSFSKIDFSINLRKLVSMIVDTIQIKADIDVEFECEEIELNVNQAIPSSLIINEVITNSIKHAFKDRKRGLIKIELQNLDDEVMIKIRDDGRGLPDNFDYESLSSLGMQLIDVLSKQMDATYNYETVHENGTEFSIQFNKKEIKGIGNAYLV
ncbi:MAG: PAS domain S-box protein [Bacteroidetes bacterium]|jgi:PAS domain S-box-containing protein|nr:PAS domain S-box protein [Bacteroidota bacterium]